MPAMEMFRLFGLVDLKGDVAYNDLRRIEGAAQSVASRFGALVKGAMSVAGGFALFEGAQRAVSAVKEAFINLNAQFEQATIGFTTMLGSGEKAKAFLEDLENFAARTPFQFPDLVAASQRMLALGFQAKEVVPMLTAVGNAAAAMGMGTEGINRIILALGQMRAKAKVSGEEMRQLTEAGIPAWEILAQAMGKSTAEVMKLSEKGLIPADQAIQALVAGMEERFPGMMDKMADTFEGATSTIRDNVNLLIKDMTEGAFEGLKNLLIAVRDWTDKVRTAFKEGGLEGVWKAIVPPGLRETLDPIFYGLMDLFERAREVAARLLPVLLDVGETLLRLLAPAGQVAIGVFNLLTSAVSWAVDHWSALKPVVMAALGAFVAFKAAHAVTGIVAGISNAVQAAQYQMKLFTMAVRDAPGALGKFSAAVQALTGVPPIFLGIGAAVVALGVLAYELYKHWDKAAPFFSALWETIKGIFGAAAASVMVVLREMQLGLAKILDSTLGNVLEFGAKVAGVFEKIPGLGRLVAPLRDAMKSAADSMERFVVDSGKSLDEAKRLVGEATSKISSSWAELKSTGAALGQAMWSDLSSIFSAGAQTVTSLFSNMKNSVVPSMKEIETAGNQLGRGLESGLGAGAEAAGKKVKEGLIPALQALEERGQILQLEYELLRTRMENTATETEKLKAQLDFQTQSLALASEKVRVLTAAYEQAKRIKGETAEETQKLYVELLKAKIAEEELKNAIDETNAEIAKQAQAAREAEIALMRYLATAAAPEAVKKKGKEAEKEWERSAARQEAFTMAMTAEQREFVKQKGREPTGEELRAIADKVKKSLDAIGLQGGGIVVGQSPLLALLHPPEAVIPLDRGKSEFLPGPVTIIVDCDGRTLARAMLPHMHREIMLKVGSL